MTIAEWRAQSKPVILRKMELWDKAEDGGLTIEEKAELERLNNEDSRLLSALLKTPENWGDDPLEVVTP